MIESINNEKVKNWSKLSDKKFQEMENLFLVEGEHLVEEASLSGNLKEVIILEGNDYNYENKTFVSEPVMKKITTLTNVPKIIGVASKLNERKIEGNVLLLDRISDPGNMGTIIRSAVAFGIDSIIVGAGSVSIYNPKVIRASEGMIFHVNIIEATLENIIPTLKKDGYTIYATDVEKGELLNETAFPLKAGIIMGSEASGVSNDIKELCDKYLYIKMAPSCESLNVGVATSIILYELSK